MARPEVADNLRAQGFELADGSRAELRGAGARGGGALARDRAGLRRAAWTERRGDGETVARGAPINSRLGARRPMKSLSRGRPRQ